MDPQIARALAIYLMNRGGGDGVGRSTSSSHIRKIPGWVQHGPEEDMQNNREQSNQGPVAPNYGPSYPGTGHLDWSMPWQDLINRYKAQQIQHAAVANADPNRPQGGSLFPPGYNIIGDADFGGGGSYGSW